jgi:hypothetical protein
VRTRIPIGLFLLAAVSPFARSEALSPRPTAEEIVAKWRSAVGADRRAAPMAVRVMSSSDEDGIAGKIEEWSTQEGDYRRRVERDFDLAETLVTPRSAVRRDWNGFLRMIRGRELARLRTAVFETNVLLFGPPKMLSHAEVSQTEDKKSYSLRATPPGGVPITWFVDAASGLPSRSVRPGDDTEITTSYEDWRDLGGVTTPHRAMVAETDKPSYRWERLSLHEEAKFPRDTFASPAAGPPDAELAPDAPPIAFNFENSHIIFPVELNGRPPMGFLLDTGADESVINEPRLADFGLKTYATTATTGGGGSAPYSYARGATFRVPGASLRDQHVAVIDQTGLERALGIPLGGLLGFDFISRFVIEVDYPKKLITLRDPKTWTYTGPGVAVPVTFDDGIPFTSGTIVVAGRSIPAYLVLDFGAAETMTLTSPFVKANDLLSTVANATVNRPAGLEKEFFAQNNVRGRVDELSFGTLRIHGIPVNLSVNSKGAYASENFSGTVGQGIFHRYRMFLDYARNRVIFEPTEESEKPFPERRTYGLNLLAGGADLRTFSVAAVRAGSPAEKDGFAKGDILVAWDGAPAVELTLGELRDRLTREGDRHTVQARRGGDLVTLPIEVRLVSIDQK